MILINCVILVIGMLIGYGVNYIVSKFRKISPKIDHCSYCGNFLHFPKYVDISRIIDCHADTTTDICKIIGSYVGNKVYMSCGFSDDCQTEHIMGMDRPEDDVEYKILTKHQKK